MYDENDRADQVSSGGHTRVNEEITQMEDTQMEDTQIDKHADLSRDAPERGRLGLALGSPSTEGNGRHGQQACQLLGDLLQLDFFGCSGIASAGFFCSLAGYGYQNGNVSIDVTEREKKKEEKKKKKKRKKKRKRNKTKYEVPGSLNGIFLVRKEKKGEK